MVTSPFVRRHMRKIAFIATTAATLTGAGTVLVRVSSAMCSSRREGLGFRFSAYRRCVRKHVRIDSVWLRTFGPRVLPTGYRRGSLALLAGRIPIGFECPMPNKRQLFVVARVVGATFRRCLSSTQTPNRFQFR